MLTGKDLETETSPSKSSLLNCSASSTKKSSVNALKNSTLKKITGQNANVRTQESDNNDSYPLLIFPGRKEPF